MEDKFERIYQELIEDDRFVEWVRSDSHVHKTYWDEWKKKNPEARDSLKKAIQSVKLLEFNDENLTTHSITEQWQGVKSKIGNKSNHSVVKVLFSKIQYAAAVLLLPFLLFSAYLIYQNSKLKRENQSIAEAQTGIIHTVEALSGTKVIVDLPDSTKVWLNSGSVLKYPARFADNNREVEIQGEGYFEVSKSQSPFLVKNSGPTVKVYGTEFNLDAYDESNITLALVEGKVSVFHQDKEFFVKSGQLVQYNSHSNKLDIGKAELEEYTSWRDGYYIFRRRSLESILQKLKYRYDCEFVVEDKELAKFRYNGKIKDLGLDQLMHFLSLTGPIDYKIEKSKSENDFDKVTVRIKRKTK